MNEKHAGIGTLNERSLHAFLKEYYEPREENREVKVGRFVADILNSNGIVEIQTRGFSNLKKKLSVFLEKHEVTVVYPVAKIKRLVWVDPVTGEATRPRLSPKEGAASEIFYELIHIKDQLGATNLKLKIVLLELYEYRVLDGWSRDRKKGSTRKDRVPVSILDEVEIDCTADYKKLLPQGLPEIFTVSDFMKNSHASRTLAQRAVNVLCSVGALKRAGKKGRAYLYEKNIEKGAP
jgi:hypothetical protein